MLNDVAKIEGKLINSAISLFDKVIRARKSKIADAVFVDFGSGNNERANKTDNQFIHRVLVQNS